MKRIALIDSWLPLSAVPEPDGKSCIVHLRETNGKIASLNLINGMTGENLAT